MATNENVDNNISKGINPEATMYDDIKKLNEKLINLQFTVDEIKQVWNGDVSGLNSEKLSNLAKELKSEIANLEEYNNVLILVEQLKQLNEEKEQLELQLNSLPAPYYDQILRMTVDNYGEERKYLRNEIRQLKIEIDKKKSETTTALNSLIGKLIGENELYYSTNYDLEVLQDKCNRFNKLPVAKGPEWFKLLGEKVGMDGEQYFRMVFEDIEAQNISSTEKAIYKAQAIIDMSLLTNATILYSQKGPILGSGVAFKDGYDGASVIANEGIDCNNLMNLLFLNNRPDMPGDTYVETYYNLGMNQYSQGNDMLIAGSFYGADKTTLADYENIAQGDIFATYTGTKHTGMVLYRIEDGDNLQIVTFEATGDRIQCRIITPEEAVNRGLKFFRYNMDEFTKEENGQIVLKDLEQ